MQGNLRLAIIRQNYRPDGGAERIIQRMLTAFSEQSLNISVLAERWQGADDAVNVIEIARQGWTRTQRFQRFNQSVQQVLSQQTFDLIQSHERVPGCQLYRAGDGVHAEWLRIRHESQLGWLGRWWQQRDTFHQAVLQAEQAMFAHEALRAVICNSQMVKDNIIRHYPQLDANKLKLIRNGIDLEHFQPVGSEAKANARKRHSLPKKCPVAIFVGSGYQRKGLQQLLQAMIRLPDWHLLVVGKDKQQQYYQKACKNWHMAHRVHFTGVLDDVREAYSAADVLIHPAWYDPAPNVILEAMAMGLPVITSTGCGNQELITPGKNGYVVPAVDVKTLTALMHDHKQGEFWRQMGENARQTVEAYPISRMTGELLSLYQHLLGMA